MSTTYLLLFAGGMNANYCYVRYQRDLQRLANTLTLLAGTGVLSTSILHGDGGLKFNILSSSVGSLPATRVNLKQAFARMATLLTASDRFIFVASNHGGPSSTGARLWCWDEEFVDNSEFLEWCKPIESAMQVYVFGQCYAGGFLPVAALNRLVLTACGPLEVSYATSDLQNDEFILRICEAIEGGASNWSEVFTHAMANDTMSEHPQISSIGAIAADSLFLVRK